jgi:translation initiation factor IF-2
MAKKMVLELAKDMGMPPLELVKTIKEDLKLDFDVKNHMTILDESQIEEIQKRMDDASSSKAASKKTKKKTTKKKATKKKTAATKKATKKVTKKKAVTKKQSSDSEEGSQASIASPSTKRQTVIRRRSRGAAAETVSEPSSESSAQAAELEASRGESGRAKAGSEAAVEAKTSKESPQRRTDGPEAVSESKTSTRPEDKIAPSSDAKAATQAKEKSDLPKTAKDQESWPTDELGRPIAPGMADDKKKRVKPSRPTPKVSSDEAPPSTHRAFRAQKSKAPEPAEPVGKDTGKKLAQAKEELRAESELKMYDFKRREIVFTPKKRRVMNTANLKKTKITKPSEQKRTIRVDGGISVSDLAQRMGVKIPKLMKSMMDMGIEGSQNDYLDVETATLLANEFNYEIQNVAFKEEEHLKIKADEKVDPSELAPRAPIVTVMGHVDHGKTSLLDAIRKEDVTSGEAGGITQHIGAYQVHQNDSTLTFLDTPGHEAFTQMRARGANVTDIAILVVAADDGVMPQTKESIDHAKAAGVPIIVAINKIDKPEANVETVKQALTEHGLVAEDWGGDILCVEVSAKEGLNLDKLLEAVSLQAELMELKARPKGPAKGRVVEAKMEKGRGPVATVLIQEGLLKKGDSIVCGMASGKVRSMLDYKGKQFKEAGPSTPVEIIGLDSLPQAGDEVDVAENDKAAKEIVEKRRQAQREIDLHSKKKTSLEDLFGDLEEGETHELSVIVKADVQGSVEAVCDALHNLSGDKVKINVISSSAGGVTESDVLLASASDAIIVAFNVRPENKARKLAEKENVEIKAYSIIYELLDEVKKAMEGLLAPQEVEKFQGRAEVRELFNVPKAGVVAGSAVIDGKIGRHSKVRLLRDSKVIYEGKVGSLRRFKEDAKEVSTGYECGIGIENFNDIKPGDIIEAFSIEEKKATL